MKEENKYWFSQKVYGLGSGPPIAWQGWAALVAYIVVMILGGWLVEWDAEVGRPTGIAVMVIATIGFLAVARAKTRGGWRWRWGRKD